MNEREERTVEEEVKTKVEEEVQENLYRKK
jgi:hypothetical protein